jgi:hypothetical protein
MTLRIFLAVLSFGAILAATTPEQSVLATEKAFGAALSSANIAALDRILADDLTYGHSTGAADSKQSYLDKIKSGAQKYDGFQYDNDMKARIYGNTAVVNATARFNSITNGKSTPTHLKFLHVYVKHNGNWQLVAHQSARLAE